MTFLTASIETEYWLATNLQPATSNLYLAVWSADHNTDGQADNESEVFGQRLDGAGVPVGPMFRISSQPAETTLHGGLRSP